MPPIAGKIPAVEHYKGVPVHDGQPVERIESVVRPEIDRVFEMSGDIFALFDFACDASHAPESRFLAAKIVHALWSEAAARREQRPVVDLELLDAITGALDSQYWRDTHRFGCLLCGPEAIRRETVLE